MEELASNPCVAPRSGDSGGAPKPSPLPPPSPASPPRRRRRELPEVRAAPWEGGGGVSPCPARVVRRGTMPGGGGALGSPVPASPRCGGLSAAVPGVRGRRGQRARRTEVLRGEGICGEGGRRRGWRPVAAGRRALDPARTCRIRLSAAWGRGAGAVGAASARRRRRGLGSGRARVSRRCGAARGRSSGARGRP